MSKDYRDTLNLPKTHFSMRAALAENEPRILGRWQEKDVYAQIRKKYRDKKKYILHDGPPYANGHIHIGHVLNKTLKDIVVKYKTMKGFDSPYLPGWDCHGLPVEHQLFKEMGINKNQISQLEFRKKAYEYALKFVAVQKQEFQRLGVFGSWQDSYLTLDPEYEEVIINSFARLVKDGYVYRGLKPVNWCFQCETALAEAEVEYEQHTSASIFVKFKLEGNKNLLANSYLVIWTTTPWTLIANVAVAAHPDFVYSYIKTAKGNLILAKELLGSLIPTLGIEKYELIRKMKGRELEGFSYEHPFGLRTGRIVLADYVSKEEGTGLVHTAPGHGNEDYITGLKYKLDIVMPVDAKGNFDSSALEFKGLNVYDANEKIIQKLADLHLLLSEEKLEHSYPHCWRCRSPIIFRATKQWFLRIDHKDLRKRLLKIIKKDISWIPEDGRQRIAAMVGLRPDWCLSRQRYWGVPIAALVCNKCQEEFFDSKVIENFAKFAAREGSDAWFKRELGDFSPSLKKCPSCRGMSFSKGSDILDVWFDSGISHQAVLKKRRQLQFPCQLYLEGSDQHRGWFQSSLIPSVCIDKKAPFEAVLTHGFVVDGKGRKMSKSLGNVISPQDIIKDYGADILRLWVASSDYQQDVRISAEILARLTEAYRKIRNTARFILSNLFDFNPVTHRVDYAHLKRIDKWILYRLEEVSGLADKSYENFQFFKAYKKIYDFCNEQLSMYYLDMIKGRLYTYAAASVERRAAQTVIYQLLNVLLRLIAPILAFTADEIWQHMPKDKNEKYLDSVHLSDWPQPSSVFANPDIEQELKLIIELMPEFSRSLEAKRSDGVIGSSFDAKINILTKNELYYKNLELLKGDLSEILRVSQVELRKVVSLDQKMQVSSIYPDIAFEVLKAGGKKCLRCWNYSESVGSDEQNPAICARCVTALKKENQR